MANLVYTALLLTDEAKKALKKEFPGVHDGMYFGEHITLEFKPSRLPLDIGKKFVVELIEYFQDDKGEAVTVKLPYGIISKNDAPHITISCAQGIKPFYSNQLITKTKGEKVKMKIKLDTVMSAFFGGKGHVIDQVEAEDLNK